MNYFSLYNLAEQFDIDLHKLKDNYQTLQKMTHPDRFANASDQQKRMYMQKNAQINDAYSVLKSDISRAEHLLSLCNVELAAEQETVGNVAFLMQQMECREALEDADDEASLQRLANDNQAHIAEQTVQLKALLAQSTEEANYQAAEKLREMKFLYKLASEISAKIDALD